MTLAECTCRTRTRLFQWYVRYSHTHHMEKTCLNKLQLHSNKQTQKQCVHLCIACILFCIILLLACDGLSSPRVFRCGCALPCPQKRKHHNSERPAVGGLYITSGREHTISDVGGSQAKRGGQLCCIESIMAEAHIQWHNQHYKKSRKGQHRMLKHGKQNCNISQEKTGFSASADSKP